MQRLLALAAFLVSLIVPAIAAQEKPTSTGSDDATWRVANGLVKAADGKMVPLPPGETILRETEAALARELAQAEVTRDFAAAAQRLAALRARATWHEVPRREDLLARIAVARAKLLERVGDIPGALRALDEFYVREGEPLTDPIGLRPASFEEMRQRQLALNTSSVRSLAERLKKAGDAPTDTDDAIAAAVGGAVAKGDPNSIGQLGRRAVPSLVRLASQGTDAWTEMQIDPLWHLMRLDEARAAQLILEYFDRGGPFWRRRALRAMVTERVLENGGTYLYEPRVDRRPRLIETWWLPVVLRFTEDPETSLEALAFVRSLSLRDALDEPLIAALARLGRSPDAGLVGALEQILGLSRGHEGTRRILEAMLDAPDAQLREFAAQNLLSYQKSHGLRAAARSADAKVRLAVVKSLQDHYVSIPTYTPDGNPTTTRQDEVRFVLEADDVDLLETLLRDANLQVRLEAIRSARQKQAAIAEATWLELARSPDAEIRKEVANAAVPDLRRDELSARILESLAQDKDPQVLEAIDAALSSYAWPGDKTINLDKFLPAIEARAANLARPFQIGEGDLKESFMGALLDTEAGRRAVGRWALSGKKEWADALALRIGVTLQTARSTNPAPGSLQPVNMNVPFDDAGLIRFLRSGWVGDNGWYVAIAQNAARLHVEHPEPWKALALDASAPIPLRLVAIGVIADRADAELASALVEVVTNPVWQSDGNWGDVIRDVFKRLPEDKARQVLAALLEKGGPQFMITRAALGFSQSHAFTPALSDAYLQRALSGPGGPFHHDVALAALNEVASRPPESRGTWLEQAVRLAPVRFQAIRLMGGLREERYRPLLVELLQARGIADSDEREDVQKAAIEAIGRYLDDESVKILLDTVGGISNASLRQACYDQLNFIKSHLSARDEWEQRRRAGTSKDSAISALLPMLDSKDATVRAQAARSLATLGAVEELPRLVKLLQDQDGTVREAAQRALEVLNASTGTPR